MNPFKHINNLNTVIRDLKYKLKFSKNEVKDTKIINTLVDANKSFNDMMVNDYYTDAIETLIYSLMHEILMVHKAYKSELPMYEILESIKKDIFYGKETKKSEVISILKTHEMNNKIKSGTVFSEGVNFDKLLNDLVNEFKLDIKWKKK